MRAQSRARPRVRTTPKAPYKAESWTLGNRKWIAHICPSPPLSLLTRAYSGLGRLAHAHQLSKRVTTGMEPEDPVPISPEGEDKAVKIHDNLIDSLARVHNLFGVSTAVASRELPSRGCCTVLNFVTCVLSAPPGVVLREGYYLYYELTGKGERRQQVFVRGACFEYV